MNCSISGFLYELMVFNIVRKITINNKRFNNQSIIDLGHCSSKNDLICLFNDAQIGLEVKKYNTPDWMQCSIKLDHITNKWIGSYKCKIPMQCTLLFNKLLNDINLFNGILPPFIHKKLTHSEWISIKKNTSIWNDHYINIPNDTISKLYYLKNCHYIQISEYGLYHLGNDICKFNVPKFIIDQHIRIRIKVHKRCDSDGYCSLSIIAACQPKNIKYLNKSNYSLDNIYKLPLTCIYNNKYI